MERKEHIVIDATGHVAGKLGAKVAKLLLEGVRVTVVCAEEAVLIGSLEKAVGKFKEYLNKRCVVNPRRGPFHYRDPRMHLMKIIKRMISYKKPRGKVAMSRLTVYEGIPRDFESQPRFKITRSLAKYTSNADRYVTLGTLLGMFGWKYGEITKRLTCELKSREESALLEREEMDKKKGELKEKKEFKDEVNRRLAMFA